MAYLITDECCVCRWPYGCIYNCPVEAIIFNGVQAEIDQEKCVSCGKCMAYCNLGAIINTDLPNQEAAAHEERMRECDIAIIGGGAAGIIAALRASELTDKKIIVLEKARNPGGCGIYSSGIRLFNTKWERDAGIPDQLDDYVRAATVTTRGMVDEKLIVNCFKALPAFFDWFCTWGDAEEGFLLDLNASLNGMRIQSRKRDNSGHYIMTKAIERCKERGIEILTEHAAESFILNQDGTVGGIVARDPGGITKISCRACLIATGNLGNCKELLQRCVPDYADAYQRPSLHLLPTCTGDGVLMAEKAGLPVDLSSIVPAYLGPGCGGPYHPMLMIQPDRCDALRVNLEAKRWGNENYIGELANWRLLKQPKCVSFTVIDSEILTTIPDAAAPALYDPTFGRCLFNGIPNEDGTPKSQNDVANFGMMRGGPADPKAFEGDVVAEIEKLTQWKGGYVFRGDTIEELALNMGVDPKQFQQTVNRYNELCRKGHDDDFYKRKEYMKPIEKAPFYAFHQFLPSDGTFGGFQVDALMRVTGTTGAVPGLYAAGDTTGSRYVNHGGEKKQIINDFSWAVSSGFIAGAQMAQYVNEG